MTTLSKPLQWVLGRELSSTLQTTLEDAAQWREHQHILESMWKAVKVGDCFIIAPLGTKLQIKSRGKEEPGILLSPKDTVALHVPKGRTATVTAK